MKIHTGMILCLVSLWLGGCGEQKPQSVILPTVDKFTDTSQLATPVPREQLQSQIPELAAYFQRVQTALQADPPILLLDDKALPDVAAQAAQKLAIANPDFLKFTRNDKTGEALRNEIMNVRKALPGDFSAGNRGPCAQTECWRVEMYHYFHNASTIAFVDTAKQQVLGVSRQNFAQPDLPAHLVELASVIAGASPEIQAILQD